MNPVEALVENTIGSAGTDPQPSEQVAGPRATCEEVLHCQFSSWYPRFSDIQLKGGRHHATKRKNVTIPSTIIQDLPEDLESYLLSDGVKLPMGADKLSSCGKGNEEWSSDEEDNHCDEEEPTGEGVSSFHFPELNTRLEEDIASLKGAVMPKLNWSAPKDATWVNGGTAKAQTPGDIYLLLKSSDFCLHDVLRRAWKDCQDYDESKVMPKLELVLRKWSNLYPSMEFRCFVRGRELIAISQRNHTQHYPHLLQDKNRIQDLILDFFEDIVRDTFAEGKLPNYVFDVYVDQQDRLWLLDFNLWAQSTDSLLFEWSDLLVLDFEDEPDFRLVETANQVRQDPLASYRAPIDTVDLASMTGGDVHSFEAFMRQCQSPTQIEALERAEDEDELNNID